jgi:predicted GIY-YIG superfamily endonuclease
VDWFVYVLSSAATARTYVGISKDPSRRLEQHNGQRYGGAKTTRAGRPWAMAKIYGPFEDRGGAQSAEAQVKRLRGADRLQWQAESS